MRPYQLLPFRVRVNLGVMAMKEYSTLLRASEMEPHHRMQFSVILRSPIFSCYSVGDSVCSLSPIWAVFKSSGTGLNSESSFSTDCYTKVKEPSLPFYLLISGGRVNGFMPFRRALVKNEMQTILSII